MPLRSDNRAWTMALRIAVGAGAAFSVSQRESMADGPGRLVFSGTPAGLDVYLNPNRAFRALGPTASYTTVLPAILEDGRPFIHAREDLAIGRAFLAMPSGLKFVSEIAATGQFVAAVDMGGVLHAWGPTPPVWSPPEPVTGLVVGSTTLMAAIGASGTPYVWNAAGQVAISGQPAVCRRISITSSWGLVVDATGRAHAIGISGNQPPVIEQVTDVHDVAVAGSASAPKAVALLTNGAIKPIGATIDAPGTFRKVTLGGYGTLGAIDSLGNIWTWVVSSDPASWGPASIIPGAYKDVRTSGSRVFAIWDPDTDQDGREDRVQILAGEMPDSNGDMVDDRRQTRHVLLDEDSNGVSDCEEVSSVDGRRVSPAEGFAVNVEDAGTRVGFFCSMTVPRGASLVDTAHFHFRNFGSSASGVALVDYSIWIDADGDGSPASAVHVGTWPLEVQLRANTRVDLPLGQVWLGPPGTRIFHGFSWRAAFGRGLGLLQGMTPGVPPGTPPDPFAASRNRSLIHYGYIEGLGASAGDSAVDPTLLTKLEPIETLPGNPFPGSVPLLGLTNGKRPTTDCNGDGLLDSKQLFNGGFDISLGIDLDVDDDGVLDACEEDCDSDATIDLAEIVAGAPDCDLDLRPDDCDGTIDWSAEGPVPSTDSATEFLVPVPQARADVRIDVAAVADLGSPTEALFLQLGDMPRITMFGEGGSDCPANPDSFSVTVPLADFNAEAAGGILAVRVTSTSLVDPQQCAGGFVRVTLSSEPPVDDCDGDGTDDRCTDLPQDCDRNGRPDSCELSVPGADLDGNGVLDRCELDCDRDGFPDAAQVAAFPALDCDQDGFIDSCQAVDCDRNGLIDRCELADGAGDCDGNGALDACEGLPDCDGDGTPDRCQTLPDCDANGVPDACEQLPDCDADGIPDTCEIAAGKGDCDGDGVPDGCETDCDGNGIPDPCDTAAGAEDKDADGLPDSCEYARGDFDLNGRVDGADLGQLLSAWGTSLPTADLDGNGVVSGSDLGILLGNWGPQSYPRL